MLVGLLLTGASVGLRAWALGLVGPSPTFVTALYVLMLSIAFDAAMLPFSFYRGFLLERRYGLSTETIRHWLMDHAKAALIGVLFAECAALFVYFVLGRWPAAWWALAGGGYAVVAIALVTLAPVVLLPLFFTFKPLEKDALRDRLTALASKAGTRIMGVYEWTLSDRTRKANAALTGMGHTRRILLSDTLLSEYSDDEIEVILAHELAHHVHRDIWTSVFFDMALTFAGFAAHLALRRAVPLFGFDGIADPAAIPVLLLTAGHGCASPVMNAVSRARAPRRFICAEDDGRARSSPRWAAGQQNLAEDSPSKLVRRFLHAPAAQGAGEGGGILGAIGLPAVASGDTCDAKVFLFPPRHHQLADHFPAPVVGGQVAVNREASGLVRPKFEDDRLARFYALRDAVLVDGEAVRNVVGRERDTYDIVC
jgi:STE24 endopeptidase